MNKTTRRGYALVLLIVAFVAAMGYVVFSFFVNGAAWSSNRANTHLYVSGQLTTAGTIFDADGKVLAKTSDGRRIFSSNASTRKSTLHIVGDPAGVISTGIHSAYKSKLSGYSFINGIYTLKYYGKGNDITTSVRASACTAAMNAMNGHDGAVGVYNYKTGALICAFSAPTYDINNPPSSLNTSEKYDGVYLNRLFSGVYTPGSTFKIVTALCALENIPDIESRTFTCNGSMEISGGKLVCMDTHGKLTFKQALNRSCNCAFAQIATELGKDKLTATAHELGFNLPLKADAVKLAISTFDVSDTNSLNLSWAGVGQYETLANPCHMMMIAGAIANGGQGISPSIVKEITSPSDITVYKSITKSSAISIDPAASVKLRELLRSNVTDWYGDSRFPGLKMCGKTGTAELDNKESHSWFVGFSTVYPYAVVVVAENAGSGSGTAMTAANAVLQSIIS